MISPRPEKPKDTSIFGGKPYLQRGELRRKFEKAPLNVPGGGQIPRKERVGLENKLFGRELGPYIDTKDVGKVLKKLSKERVWAKTGAKRMEADRKIRFFKGLFGK